MSVAFSGDGQRLLSASFDRTARLWDVRTGRLLRTFAGHRGWVWAAAFCYRHDAAGRPLPERYIVTASQDGFALVWDLDKPSGAADETRPPFRGHQGPVYAAAFSPDGQTVVTGGNDKQVLAWKPDELREFEYENLMFNETRPPGSSERPRPVSPPQYRAFLGHSAAVRSVAFDRQGKRIVSGGHDHTVRIWDFDTGKLLKTLRGHGSWVRGCLFSPDDRWVFSAGYDQQVRRWDVERYEELRRVPQGRELEGHAGDIMAAVFSRDGKYVLTASRDRTARLWDVSSARECLRFEEGHVFLASSGLFFPDGRKLLTAAVDNTARIWDVTTGTELARLERTGRHAAIAVSGDGRWVLTGAASNTAQLWELAVRQTAEGRPMVDAARRQELSGHKAPVTAVAFSADSRFIFSGDASGRGKLWDASKKPELRLLGDLRGHTGRITAAAFLPGNRRVVTASADGTAAQWMIASCEERRDLLMRHTRGATVTSLAITPDGRHALTSCDDGKVRLWELETAQVVRELKAGQRGPGPAESLVRSVAVSPDGRMGVSVDPQALAVRLWDLHTGLEIGAARGDGSPRPFLDFRRRGLVWSACFSPDGAQIATVGGDSAHLWNVDEGRPPERETQVFVPHGAVACAGFSPDGQRVVTSGWDGSARIWNARTGKCERKLEGHEGPIHGAAFSPDGQRALTESEDSAAKLWDTQRRGEDPGQAPAGTLEGPPRATEILTLKGHQREVSSVAFSADGTLALTGSRDGTAIIWLAAEGQAPATLAQQRQGDPRTGTHAAARP